MVLRGTEIKALQTAKPEQQICIWTLEEPPWREGKRYRERTAGEVTVLSVLRVHARKIRVVDVKRSGWATYSALVETLLGEAKKDEGWELTEVWESRMVRGDATGRPRLLRHIGGKDPNYVDQPHLAMGGDADPGEALTDAELEEIAHRGRIDREARIDEFKRRTIEEARTLLRGEDTLRSFERVTNALGGNRRA